MTKTSHGKGMLQAIKEIEKEYGKNSLVRFGDSRIVSGPFVSTGSLSLDCALGGRGLPFGRVVEIFGPESSGKTTLALHIMANVQAMGFDVAMIDAEHALDPPYAERLGVNIEDLMFSQPDHGEQALGIAQKLIKYKAVRCIVVDSVAGLVPKAELEGEMGDDTIALQARLMGKAMRKLVGRASKNSVLVIFINQVRETIGGGFKRNVTPGGRALKFYASVRIEVRRTKTEKEKEKAVSNITQAKVVKSKICAPFGVAFFYITFGKGINKALEIFRWARQGKIIKRSGSKFTFKKLSAKGKKQFIKDIRKKPKLRKALLKRTKKYILSQF